MIILTDIAISKSIWNNKGFSLSRQNAVRLRSSILYSDIVVYFAFSNIELTVIFDIAIIYAAISQKLRHIVPPWSPASSVQEVEY